MVGDAGATALYAKVSPAATLDLSEVVKHEDARSDSPRALFAWADTKGKRVTLTAADGPLVRIYGKYGFEGADGRPLPTGDTLKAKNINFPMQLSDERTQRYRSECREDVFWQYLPDLVSAD